VIETNIEWCDSTINGSSGCDGCELWDSRRKSCYAGITHERRWSKSLAVTMPQFYSPSFDVVKMIPGRYARAAAWDDLTGTERPDKPWLNGLPRMIFVGDMGDFLSRDVTDEFLMHELFGAITSELGRRHFWLLLTKRPKRLASLSERMQGGLPDNCMAMTTATDQRTANVRVRQLLEVKCRWRGLSCEPLLGRVDLTRIWPHTLNGDEDNPGYINAFTGEAYHPKTCLTGPNYDIPQLHWVIGGGESGNGDGEETIPRPTHPDDLRSLRDQCGAAGVPFFFKQHGDWIPVGQRLDLSPNFPLGTCLARGAEVRYFPDGMPTLRIGKKRANKAGLGRLLSGREWNEMPEIRDFASAGASSPVQ
jgi:protein gp37